MAGNAGEHAEGPLPVTMASPPGSVWKSVTEIEEGTPSAGEVLILEEMPSLQEKNRYPPTH